MLVLGIAIVAAALIPLLTRGSYTRLFRVELRWSWLLGAGLAIQLVLEYVSIPRQYWHSYGFGLLVASYVLILAFCARNLVLRGMGIVFIGIACNALVIAIDQGMPVKIPARFRDDTLAITTVKHHPKVPGDHLIILSDIIILEHPYDVAMSFGDLILAVGICDVAYNASRNPRKRRRRARRPAQQHNRPARLEPPGEAPAPASYAEAAFSETYVGREPDLRAAALDVHFDAVDDAFTPKSRTSHR